MNPKQGRRSFHSSDPAQRVSCSISVHFCTQDIQLVSLALVGLTLGLSQDVLHTGHVQLAAQLSDGSIHVIHLANNMGDGRNENQA